MRTRDDPVLRLALSHDADTLLRATACRVAAELIKSTGGAVSAKVLAEHVDRYRLALIEALAAVEER
jgi:hypothetical protein